MACLPSQREKKDYMQYFLIPGLIVFTIFFVEIVDLKRAPSSSLR